MIGTHSPEAVSEVSSHQPTSLELNPYLFSIRKRLFDMGIGVAGGLLTAPVTITAIGLNKLLHPHDPPLYPAKRIGMGGQEVTVWKIRTVTGNAQGETHFHKIDPSLSSPYRRFLRRFRIDELPQFWSIAKGDLTVFGIRVIPDWDIRAVREAIMITPVDNEEDRATLFNQWQEAYFTYKPAAAGLAQLSTLNRPLTARERLERDLQYIRQASLGFDIMTALKAPFAIARGKGLIKY